MRASSRFILISLAIIALLLTGHHVDAEAHPHQGKVTPFQPGDPKVKLDGKAISILKQGKPYQTQVQSGSSGRGMVVQDVEAPTSVVWDRILDYNNYSKMVPKTIDSKNYKVEKHRDGSQTIYTRMKIGLGPVRLTFYVKHNFQPKLNSMTWTLDYQRKSDFDDSCGYWYVIPHPDNPEQWTRLYYSVEVSMFDWVPKFVVNFLSTKALTDATAWVKKYSEEEYAKMGPVQTTKQEKTRWAGGLFLKKKPEPEEEECDEPGQVALRKGPTPVGLTRYALITSVFSLSIYNVHLYLSQ
jgi:hypothetical protein